MKETVCTKQNNKYEKIMKKYISRKYLECDGDFGTPFSTGL